MRLPAAQGFYPSGKNELETAIKKLFEDVKVTAKSIRGAVVPHAGYVYSGKTASYIYKSLKDSYETIILLGPNHTHLGEKVAVSLQDWETPLGVVKNDRVLGRKIASQSNLIKTDELAHMYEHSLEVQLPFLQYALKDFKIVPISISVDCFNIRASQEIGNAIKKAVGDKKVLIIASSDFTHFGSMYNFTPVKQNQLEWVKKTDNEIINAIIKNNPEKVIELSLNTTVCGYGAIASLMLSLDKPKAKLLNYTTSYDVSKNKDAIVGYAGIVFE